MLSIIAIQKSRFFKYTALIVLSITLSVTTKAGEGGTVIIPAGTKVELKATGTVMSDNNDKAMESKTARLNDFVIFKVTEDVEVDGIVVIKAGTEVEGTVIKSVKPGHIGRPGTFTIEFPRVASVNHKMLSLSDNKLLLVGKDKRGTAIGLAVILGLLAGFVFFAILALKGDPAIIYGNHTTIDCSIANDTVLKL